VALVLPLQLLLLLLLVVVDVLLNDFVCCWQLLLLVFLPLPLLPPLLCGESVIVHKRVTLLYCKLLNFFPGQEDVWRKVHDLHQQQQQTVGVVVITYLHTFLCVKPSGQYCCLCLRFCVC
jgi:hypothetical protein